MSALTVTDRTDENLPAVECAPWCLYGDGHTDATHPDDQRCYGEPHIVRLTRQRVQTYKGERWLDNVQFYLARHAGQTYLSLNRDDGVGVELTLTEAAELRDDLSALLKVAESAPGGSELLAGAEVG
jgi:hypothetical protein